MAKKRRFYRANLPTVIWNKDTDRALVEFVKGEFTTSNEKIANILISKGYPEVDLDAVDPPDFQVQKGKSIEKGENVKIMPPRYDEKAALNKQLALAALEKANASKKSTPKVSKSKRKVRRRS